MLANGAGAAAWAAKTWAMSSVDTNLVNRPVLKRTIRDIYIASTSALTIVSILVLGVVNLSSAAWAAGEGGVGGLDNGGAGGAGNGTGGGGAAGTPGVGNGNGLPGSDGNGGNGGYSNYGALGFGGPGGTVGATTFIGVSVIGGNGTNGFPDPGISYGSGGGGGGGDGIYTADSVLTIGSGIAITGGTGGAGGTPNRIAGGGGGGGAGLTATSAGVVINNAGTLTGGNGGAGGEGQFGGGGGGGGDGLRMTGGSGQLTNTGAIIGGNGGVAGPGQFVGTGGEGGAGLRVSSNGNIIVNSGTLSGGLSGDLARRAEAVVINGDDNRLELRAGSTIIGNLLATGSGNILALGGDTTDASTVLDASIYRGFTSYEKVGASTWTLTGSSTEVTPWRLAGGTLSVSSDASMGAAAGGVTFDGGTLATTASFDTARAFTLTQAGRFDVAAGTEFGITGLMTGSGDLIKQGDGTLRLDNTGNAYGNTFVQAGTLIGNAASISGHIGNAGTVVFDQSANGSFAGDIAALNGTPGAMIKRGIGALALTGTSSLDWSVEAGRLVSAAERFSGNVAIDAGASFAFNQTANASYAGVLSGTGDFVKDGVGQLTLTGNSSGFTGTTSLEAGTLAVNGSLGGTLDVLMGGRLQGTGTVGNVLVSGTIAPGNSIGTLSVAGNIQFNAGSVFEVEANAAGAADRINASGTATINGGDVRVLAGDGTYAPSTRYTILSADGGRSGMFAGVSSNLAFLDPSLSYDSNNVYLTLTRNQISFSNVGQTRNQIAAGAGVESLGMGNVIYNAVVNLTEGQARAAFDSLSGEIHASAKSALIDDSHFVREAAIDRTRSSFSAVGASSVPVMAYAPGGPQRVAPTSERFAVWGQAFGGWGRINGDGNAARLDHSTGGFLIGADALLVANWRLGLLAGYSRTSFDVKNRLSSGASDNYHLGLYGGTQWGHFGLRGGVAYTWHDLSTSRAVIFPGFVDSLKSKYRAGTFQAFGDLGYRIDTNLASFEPFASLAYVSLNTDGFTEQGGAAALFARGQSMNVGFSTLGLRASTSFDLGGVRTTLRGSLGWRHAFGDVTPLSTQVFAGGGAFTVAGVPIARDAAVVETRLDFALSRSATFGVSYNGQLASRAQQHAFKANLAINF